MLFKTEQLKSKHESFSNPIYLCCTICIEIILRLKELIFANYLKTHISVLFSVGFRMTRMCFLMLQEIPSTE